MDQPNTGARLHADEAGVQGPFLVLVHGFGGLAAVWAAIIGELSRSARIIAYDLPGHGGSLSYPGAGPAKVAVRAIIEDLDRRGVECFHLAGHSMGGAISTLIAIAAPERVSTLTLLSPGGMGEEINRDQLLTLARAVTPDEVQAALAPMYAPGASPDPVGVAALAQSRVVDGQTEMLLGIAEAITRGGRQGVIPRDLLAALPMPVTVIWGTEDSTLPHSQTGNLPPNFRVVSIENAGHMLVEEAPAQVLAALRGALGVG